MRADDLSRCWLMMEGKLAAGVLGSGLPFAVGAVLGPHSVGIYDAVSRLPRFSKIVNGLLTAAVLPVASRLEQGGQTRTLRAIAYTSIVIIPAVTLPPLVGAALLSTNILRLWVGPTIAEYGSWMGLLFLMPMSFQYLSIGNTMLMTRPSVQSKLNRLLAVQIPIIAVVVAATVVALQERSFMLAQVVAALLVLPLQMQIMIYNLDLDIGATWRALALQIGVLGGAALIFHYLTAGATFNIVELCIVFGAWCMAVWTIQYAVTLSAKDRATIHELVRLAVFGRTALKSSNS